MNSTENHQRVVFHLEKDEEGYPPNEWENLWALPVGPSLFRIDNIPFYARGVSWGDVVSVDDIGGELRFREVVQHSGHSVLRVIVFDRLRVPDVHDALRQMGCDTEQSHLPGLLSVDVAESISLGPVLDFLDAEELKGFLEYEEGSIRHEKL